MDLKTSDAAFKTPRKVKSSLISKELGKDDEMDTVTDTRSPFQAELDKLAASSSNFNA